MIKRIYMTLLAIVASVGMSWGATVNPLPGKFSVADGTVVYFSKGNLQYDIDNSKWQFAADQFTFIGNAAGNTSMTSGVIDLFGWGTGSNPTLSSTDYSDYSTFTDWGVNAISNGGNTANTWRTLTKDEWVYLFYTRTDAATLFGLGSVNGVNGTILLPDNWTLPEGASFTASTTQGLADQGSYYYNSNGNNFSHNTYTAEQWSVMESAGAVFLPAAGYRIGTNVNYVGSYGYYWSSTPFDTYDAYRLYFSSNNLSPQYSYYRYGGLSVRLVTGTAPAADPLADAAAVVALIDAIGEVTYPDSKDAIDAARAAYDALSDEAKGLLDAETVTALTDAETAYATAKGNAINAVIAAINALPDTPLAEADKKLSVYDKVTSARALYDALNDEEKAAVTNYDKLTAAEEAFAALSGGGGNATPTGALNGAFTIGDGTVVYFSKGNLQYDIDNTKWQFAADQFTFIGNAAGNTSMTSGVIDLFGWGTGSNPTLSSTDYSDYSTFTDWGVNAISNGGNTADTWRTLTTDEWVYLFYTRTDAATLFGLGSVNGVNGTILLPDDWTLPEGASFTASTTQGLADQGSYYYNSNGTNFSDNTYTAEQWSVMESAGAVFLPAAGYRYGTDMVYSVGSNGGYWSATPVNTGNAYSLNFYSSNLNPQGISGQFSGLSVRLVTGTASVTSDPIADAYAAVALIDAIPVPVVLTDECKAAIDAARAAVDALGENASLLDDADLAKLTQAEADYADLQTTKQAAEVDALIEAIGEVTYPDSKDAITAAREAYNALSEAAQAKVTKLETLTAAEEAYAGLLDQAVAPVIEAINALPNPVQEADLKLSVYNKVTSARALYDALNNEEKAAVTNYDKLTAAEAEFAALSGGGGNATPTGALNGAFTIGDGTVVYFSQGNLQYDIDNSKWQFAADQFTFIGNAAGNTSMTSGVIDLFGWGTGSNPTLSSTDYSDYSTFTDWGVNAISNGGNTANTWRTLTNDEWVYLFYTRTNAATLFGLGSVNGVNGTILLPDNWTLPEGASFTASTTQGLADQGSYYYNSNGNNFSHNTYTAEQWSVMESAGAVFLPAAGNRYGTGVYGVGSNGDYWSSSPFGTDLAYFLYFNSYYLNPQDYYNRGYGLSVRLVTGTASVTSDPIADAFAAVALIDAIPVPVVYTDVCKEAIDAAREAYDALNDAAKSLIDDEDLAKLTAAEADYAALKLAADQAAAEAATALIDAIPQPVVYTEACKDSIDAARAAYDALTAEQKALVDDTKLQALTDAEAAYAQLKADHEAASAVTALIDAIGEVTYPGSKDAIDAAREAYDALRDEAKALISAEELAKLTDAEAAWAALVEKIEHNVSYIGKDGELKNEIVALMNIPDAPDVNGYEFVQWNILSGELFDGITIKPTYTPIITTDPQAINGIVYNGTAQTLITAGVAKEGHIEYRIAGEDTWSTELPQATTAGVYAVQYKLVREGHEDYLVPQGVVVSIAKTTVTYTEPTAVEDLTYNYEQQTLIAAGTTADGTFEYTLTPSESESWSTALPQGLNAGTYNVYFRVKGDINHYDSIAPAPVAVTIAKRDIVVTAPQAYDNLVYNAALQTLAAAGTADFGTLLYTLTAENEESWSAEMPQAVTTGTYTVYYRVAGDANHNDFAAQSIEASIAQAPLTITAEDKTIEYGWEAPEFTVTYEGFLGTDDESLVSGLAYTCTYAQGSYVGAYSIEPNSATAHDYAITFVDGTLTVDKAAVIVSEAEVQIAKFEDGNTDAVVLNNGILNGVKLGDPIAHVTTATFSDATVGEHKVITVHYELTGDAALLNNYDLILTSEPYFEEGTIIENFVADNNPDEQEDDEAEVKEGIEVYAYGYCDGSGYSLRYHLNSGNPDQYKIDFSDSRFTDVAWTNLVTPGADGTIDIEIPVDMPTGDYSMTVTFRDSRFDWLESNPFIVTFHVNLPETYVTPLFDNTIALVDTCNCFTDIQWYYRANASEPWKPIEGATGHYYHVDGKLTGEYFVKASMNGVPTYTCGQSDMETLYGADSKQPKAIVKAFPNPVTTTTNVTIEGSMNYDHNLRIVNLMGVEMMNTTFEGNETKVDMNGYVQGNYMISVDGIVVKVMKQ